MLYQSERNNIVIDVTQAPYFADNTGRVDCTDILCRVLDDILIREVEGVDAMRARLMADPREDCRIGFENRKVKGVPTVIFPEDPPTAKLIYFPRGTYLVSDTITYSLETLKNTINDQYSSELNRFIHIVGEDKEHTIIRLQDNCRPFRYGEKRPVLSLMRGAFSNVAMMNTVENITIDLGKGNPGAIGLYYVASNTGRVQNLNVVATDGFGYAGIHLDLGLNCVFKDLYISDCKTGILNTSHGHDQIYENLVMERVETGVDSTGGLIGLLNAHISCRGNACVSRNFNMLSVLNSHLIHEGEQGGTGIRNFNAYVLVRDTQIDNFGTAISEMYEAAIKENGYIDEYSNSLEYRMFTKWDGRFRLPIEPQPTYTWNGDRSIVAEVDAYGAVGDGKTDSTAAIQAAMNSGKEYIVFGEGRYLVSGEIKIPATVKAINFMFCDFAAHESFCEQKGKGLFCIEEDSDDVLFMDDAFVFEKFYGYIRFVRHSAKRDLAMSDVHVQTGAVYFNTVPGSKVYLENTASTMGVFGGHGYGTTPCYHFVGQKVWARQFNPERSTDNCLTEGSDIWIFGFKTEGPSGKGFTFRDGSRAEAICGDATIATNDGTPCIENTESDVFAFMRTGGCGPCHTFEVAVKETQGGLTRCLDAEDMPPYLVEYYFIPGYIGIRKPK